MGGKKKAPTKAKYRATKQPIPNSWGLARVIPRYWLEQLPPQCLSRSINLLQLPHQPPSPCRNICWVQWKSHKSLTAPVENKLKVQSKPHTCKRVLWQPAKFVSSAKKEEQLSFSILLTPRLSAGWGLPLLHTCNVTSAPTAQLWEQNGQRFLFQVQKDVCPSPQAEVRVLREAVVIHTATRHESPPDCSQPVLLPAVHGTKPSVRLPPALQLF